MTREAGDIKSKLSKIGAEWLDTLVVAISVAMAFRAYFYEPFNIPTGSMQPTLYGNHTEECRDAGIMQKTPLKWLNWIFTGRDYKELVAPFTGQIVYEKRNDGRFAARFYSPVHGVSKAVNLPTDVLGQLQVSHGAYVTKGEVLWKGYDTTGDFIFVNRWLWNFRQPARGDVMIFSTTGINGLVQGTHYLKRMTALPGGTVEIIKPDVFIDGRKIAPLKPMTGKRGEKTPEPEPGGMKGAFKLGEDEYFACGDNSSNSGDSRYWGAVPGRNLRGVASCVFWPIINSRWGGIQ